MGALKSGLWSLNLTHKAWKARVHHGSMAVPWVSLRERIRMNIQVPLPTVRQIHSLLIPETSIYAVLPHSFLPEPPFKEVAGMLLVASLRTPLSWSQRTTPTTPVPAQRVVASDPPLHLQLKSWVVLENGPSDEPQKLCVCACVCMYVHTCVCVCSLPT